MKLQKNIPITEDYTMEDMCLWQIHNSEIYRREVYRRNKKLEKLIGYSIGDMSKQFPQKDMTTKELRKVAILAFKEMTVIELFSEAVKRRFSHIITAYNARLRGENVDITPQQEDILTIKGLRKLYNFYHFIVYFGLIKFMVPYKRYYMLAKASKDREATMDDKQLEQKCNEYLFRIEFCFRVTLYNAMMLKEVNKNIHGAKTAPLYDIASSQYKLVFK